MGEGALLTYVDIVIRFCCFIGEGDGLMGEVWYGKEGRYDVGWLETRALGTGSWEHGGEKLDREGLMSGSLRRKHDGENPIRTA